MQIIGIFYILWNINCRIKKEKSLKNEPAFLGTSVQLPIPCLDTYASIFASSSAVQRPLLTFNLSQQGGLTIARDGVEGGWRGWSIGWCNGDAIAESFI